MDNKKQAILLPAVLSGRSRRSGGVVVHLVECDESERRSGIRYLASALCGKTHGPRSAGWAHGSDFGAATCPKCLKLAKQREEPNE